MDTKSDSNEQEQHTDEAARLIVKLANNIEKCEPYDLALMVLHLCAAHPALAKLIKLGTTPAEFKATVAKLDAD